MDVGDYYSKSVESFRRNWKIMVPQFVASILIIFLLVMGFFGIMAVLSPELKVMETITPYTFFNMGPGAILTADAILLVIGILVLIITAIAIAATVGMAKKIIKEGFLDLDVAWESGIKYFPKIIVVSIIEGIGFIIIALPLIMGIYLLFTDGIMQSAPLILLGSLIFLIGGILIALIFFVVNQSIVVGEKSVINSIKDSYHVFWDNKLRVFLVALINVVIAFAVGMLLGLILTPLSLVTEPITMQIINQIGGYLINIILVPYFILVVTYMYIDLKK